MNEQEIARIDIEYAQNLGDEEIMAIMHDTLFDLETGVETADGCWVEPDGRCTHGHRSPLVTLGLI